MAVLSQSGVMLASSLFTVQAAPLAFLSVHILTDTTTYLAININIFQLDLSQQM